MPADEILPQAFAFSYVGLSTSGGSANVIRALEEARNRGLPTAALLGYDGGEIRRRGLADLSVIVPSDYIPRIQEVQASIYLSSGPGADGERTPRRCMSPSPRALNSRGTPH